MYAEVRCARRYPFVATAEVQGSDGVRSARVRDLSIAGAYLALPDIPTTYNLFSRLGYMHGLWMLVHRTGHRILIRYESWLRPDTNIQSNIEVVQIIRHHLAAHLERRQPFL
jgi:hypothetical protein